MSAIACLECKPNSHPFQERTLTLTESVKIGRSVARARPTISNAIFDCKVLSRNHALLWFENGKFFLKDTKSSNGTFVNNYRLSKGSEESSPQEVFSGDVVQFGVDVMENSKKGTVTHGCIIATLKLYLPDGQEAKSSLLFSSPSIMFGGEFYDVSSQDVSELYLSLREALQRERMIESKLSSFQQIVLSIQDATSKSWNAMIEEDRLLQHIELLENQLAFYGKNCSEDTAKEEMKRVLEEKYKYETSAKESFQRLLEEKMQTMNKCGELERSLSLSKKTINFEKESTEVTKKELENALNKLTTQTTEIKNLTSKIEELENELSSLQKLEKNKNISNVSSASGTDDEGTEEKNLSVKFNMLKAEKDLLSEQLASFKTKYREIKDLRLTNLEELINRCFEASSESENHDLDSSFQVFRSTLQHLQDKLWQAQEELQQTRTFINHLTVDAEAAIKAEEKYQSRKAELQDELCDKTAKQESNATLIDHLKNQIEILDGRIQGLGCETLKIEDEILGGDTTATLCRYKKDTNKTSEEDSNLIQESANLISVDNISNSTLVNEDDVIDKNALNGNDSKKNKSVDNTQFLKEDIEKLKETLSLAETSKASAESEVKRIQEELSKVSAACLTSTHEATNLQHQLAASESILMEKRRYVAALLDLDSQFDFSIDMIFSHLNALVQRLSEEKKESCSLKEDNGDLKSKLLEAEFLSETNMNKMEILNENLIYLSEVNGGEKEFNTSQVENLDDRNSVNVLSNTRDDILNATKDNSLKSEIVVTSAVSDVNEAPSLTEEKLDRKIHEISQDIRSTRGEVDVGECIDRHLMQDADQHQNDSYGRIEGEIKNLKPMDVVQEEKETVVLLRRELDSLREEHRKLKESYLLNNGEFADLAMQNKISIPTWFMLILIIPLALGWQSLCQWL